MNSISGPGQAVLRPQHPFTGDTSVPQQDKFSSFPHFWPTPGRAAQSSTFHSLTGGFVTGPWTTRGTVHYGMWTREMCADHLPQHPEGPAGLRDPCYSASHGVGQMLLVNQSNPELATCSRLTDYLPFSPYPLLYPPQEDMLEKDYFHPLNPGKMSPSSYQPLPSSSFFQPPAYLSYNLMRGPKLSQCHQTPLCPDPPSLATAAQPKAARQRSLCGAAMGRMQTKPCSCTKSHCLKMYCDCFANGDICSNCNCVNCCNNADHEKQRSRAIQSYLYKNPKAFQSKNDNKNAGDAEGRHKGCNCKRSRCLKNYCECYEAQIMCSSTCRCVGCRNYSESADGDSNTWVIRAEAVEDACDALLVLAEKSERGGCTLPQAEQQILQEFGQRLAQVAESIFKCSSLQRS
ncbi:spexin prohormone 2 isoform X2 [Denticeps clupeoides]|uniref:spexin prohormone 2 isoform X2 n=1 Tax=Denticeps clupeoides TaxID=299321 RepID=UPI0010A52D73|nr:protein lin-54 homolog isoform X2 [Denticeps clupeoides]